MRQIYVIDTSAFSSWWSRSYPIDVFPGLWSYLSDLMAEGRLVSSAVVREELKQGADQGLQDWVKEQAVDIFLKIMARLSSLSRHPWPVTSLPF